MAVYIDITEVDNYYNSQLTMYYNSLFTINSLNIVLSYYPLKPLNNAYALKEELDRFVHRRESGWLKQPDLY